MITSLIEKLSPDLTPAERKIASWVLAHPRNVVSMPVHQLAQECGVASSAVIRFCRSVGLSGYSDLKIALAEELGGVKEELRLPAFEDGEDPSHIMQKVFSTGARTLIDTCSMIDNAKAEQMAAALDQAKRIFIFGIGTSSVIAVDAQYRLSQLGLWATAYTDILFMNVSAVNLGPGDVVLAISHSGRTKAVVDALRSAKDTGATTLSITSFSTSILYQESDIAIAVFADEEHYPVEAVSARLAHLCLIDAITMLLATKNFDSFAAHVKARNQILNDIRYEQL